MPHNKPMRRSDAILNYIRANFSVVDGNVIRKDGYIGWTATNGYKIFNVPWGVEGKKQHRILAHHISFYLHYGRWPEYELDHFDWNKKNNDPTNLREDSSEHRALQYESYNKGKGYTKGGRSFKCYIRKDGKELYLGRAKTESMAIQKVAIAKIALLDEWEESFIDRKERHINEYLERRKLRLAI